MNKLKYLILSLTLIAKCFGCGELNNQPQVQIHNNEVLWSSIRYLQAQGVDIEKIDPRDLFKHGPLVVRNCRHSDCTNNDPWRALLLQNRGGLFQSIDNQSQLTRLLKYMASHPEDYLYGAWLSIYNNVFCKRLKVPTGNAYLLNKALQKNGAVGRGHPSRLVFAEWNGEEVLVYKVRVRNVRAAIALSATKPPRRSLSGSEGSFLDPNSVPVSQGKFNDELYSQFSEIDITSEIGRTVCDSDSASVMSDPDDLSSVEPSELMVRSDRSELGSENSVRIVYDAKKAGHQRSGVSSPYDNLSPRSTNQETALVPIPRYNIVIEPKNPTSDYWREPYPNSFQAEKQKTLVGTCFGCGELEVRQLLTITPQEVELPNLFKDGPFFMQFLINYMPVTYEPIPLKPADVRKALQGNLRTTNVVVVNADDLKIHITENQRQCPLSWLGMIYDKSWCLDNGVKQGDIDDFFKCMSKFPGSERPYPLTALYCDNDQKFYVVTMKNKLQVEAFIKLIGAKVGSAQDMADFRDDTSIVPYTPETDSVSSRWPGADKNPPIESQGSNNSALVPANSFRIPRLPEEFLKDMPVYVVYSPNGSGFTVGQERPDCSGVMCILDTVPALPAPNTQEISGFRSADRPASSTSRQSIRKQRRLAYWNNGGWNNGGSNGCRW